MSARRTVIALLLPVLVLSAAWSAGPAVAFDPLTPPDVVAPTDGATIAAGSAVTFQVRSGPGDDYLWVHISRSPAAAETCGTIGSDVATAELTATAADPMLYEATPTNFDTYSFWLNRPGTYYWQAYRIEYGGGADGCIEAPVRSLTVTGIRPVEIGPQPLSPADGATLPAGPQTFQASAMATDKPGYVWLHVSRSPQITEAGGLISHDAAIESMTQTADPAVWSAAPPYLTSPSFWMNTAGTYYWQPYRISSFGDPDGVVEGPVRSFTLTAPATPVTPVTIRGDAAFTSGTANDLYLACTKLDLLLVDVLPASRGTVWVTGAADLRLRGQTVDILLDGRRVGSAVVGTTGAFQATVRAPSRTRLAKARYQARAGTARSQNLKLERRMVTARLTRSRSTFTLTGQITKPFARRPATIGVQRYRSCRRKERLVIKGVRPTASGHFTIRFPVPAASARALMYRATTKVATRAGGNAATPTFTLPRAIDVG